MSEEKKKLHRRNRNREPYDLEKMRKNTPELSEFIVTSKYGRKTINFSNQRAVRVLNRAILQHYYGIEYWDFPKHNLCPPIPGRADYIHHMSDLLNETDDQETEEGPITCLDIGVGASIIYPIIGIVEYQWNFIGSDIDAAALESAANIANKNPVLDGKVVFKKQTNAKYIFNGIIDADDRIDVSICNPPFHSSKEEAQKSTRRKVKNLSGKRVEGMQRNFSGNTNELIYEGGELQFIRNMIRESIEYAYNIRWFSTLVSKESNLPKLRSELNNLGPTDVRVVDLATGNKKSRILAWTFR